MDDDCVVENAGSDASMPSSAARLSFSTRRFIAFALYSHISFCLARMDVPESYLGRRRARRDEGKGKCQDDVFELYRFD